MGLKEDDNLIQENIQEFVQDDNKIVTCKWLSLTLSIPVNSAKLALFQFVSNARQSGNNDDINVTYFVSGFETKECGTKVLKCVVVPESHLESLKQKMDPVTSCHVYSVHKAKLKDYTPLYQADYDICRENAETLNKFSSISCPWAVLREDQPAAKVLKDSTQKPSNKGTETVKSSSPLSKPTASLSNEAKDNDKKGTSANKKGGIASMFAAAGKKENKSDKSSGSKTDSKSATSVSKGKDAGNKKGVESMFKGQAKKTELRDVKQEKEASPKQGEVLNVKQKNQSKSEKSQKHKLSGNNEPQKRKRRRIRNDLFDSSDEELDKNEDDDVDDVDVEMTDHEDDDFSKEDKQDTNFKEEDEDEHGAQEKNESDAQKKTEKSIIVVKDGKRRKRTRKLVPRQHVDEDGFMVTEKVWESDSTNASDEEDTATATTLAKASTSSSSSPTKARNPAKPGPPANKKKSAAVSPSKNKQTSLMSFFKKK